MGKIHLSALLLLLSALLLLILANLCPHLVCYPRLVACIAFFTIAVLRWFHFSKPLVVLFSFGYLFYTLIGWATHTQKPQFAIKPEYITSLEGTLVEDSLLAGEDLHLCRVQLTGGTSNDDGAFSASGLVTFLCDCDEFLLSRSKVWAEGRFGEDHNLFKCRSIQVTNLPRLTILRRELFRRLEWLAQRRFSDTGAQSLAMMLLLGRSSDDAFLLKDVSISAGCAHILALSGMHLQFFLRISFWLCSSLVGSFWGKRLGLLLPLAFVAMVGPKPSLLRALGMHVCTLLLPASKEMKGTLAYCLTLVVHLVFIPSSIQSYGFLFSYLSYGALLVSQLLPPFKPRFLDAYRQTALAILVTALPCLHLMGYWNLAGLVLAIPATALIHIAMAFSFLGLCFGPPYAQVLLSIHKALYALLCFGSYRLPFRFGKGALSIYALAVLTCLVSIGYAGHALQKRRREAHELAVRIRFTSRHQDLVGN